MYDVGVRHCNSCGTFHNLAYRNLKLSLVLNDGLTLGGVLREQDAANPRVKPEWPQYSTGMPASSTKLAVVPVLMSVAITPI